MKFTSEQIAKAKVCKNVEEILAYANEVGYKLTEDEAKNYYELWHKEGELAEEELDNVAAGSTCVNGSHYSDDAPHYLITTMGNSCNLWEGKVSPSDPHMCTLCKYRQGDVPLYCTRRTLFNDPCNSSIGGK